MIANSPSKLRALAAAHSTFGSPNRATSASRSAGRKAEEGIPVVGSPKKYNPFAVGSSPAKKGIFDAEIKQRQKEKGLGEGKTREGAGWGSSDATRGWESMFSSAAPRASSSRRMEEEEEFDTTMDEDYAAMIDEALGPSPVKPAAGKRKEFKPLFHTTTETAAPPPPPPKPFTAAFTSSLKTTKAAQGGASHSSLRGTKRAPTPPAEVEEPDSEFEDDATKSKGAKAKRKKVVAGAVAKGKGKATVTNGKGRAKGKSAMDVDGDDEDEEGIADERRKIGSALVLDMEVGEGGDKVDRVFIHPRRPYYKAGGHDRNPEGMDRDDGEDEKDDDELVDSQGASLFYRDSADLLASQHPHSQHAARVSEALDSDDDHPHSQSHPHDDDTPIDASLLPSELASILSLRSSPIKKTAQKREKERDSRVKELLMDPSRRKKVTGLVDLAEAAGSEGEEEAAEQGGSDDDWASDAEGWKDLGDGEMDGYDERW